VLGLVYLNLFQMAYIGQVKPRSVRRLRRIETFNEFSTQMIMLSLLWYTNWLPDEETKFKHAWGAAGLLGLTIGLNLTFVIISGVQ